MKHFLSFVAVIALFASVSTAALAHEGEDHNQPAQGQNPQQGAPEQKQGQPADGHKRHKHGKGQQNGDEHNKNKDGHTHQH